MSRVEDGDLPRAAAQGDLDLRQLMRGIGARKWWIIAPTLATLGLTFAAVTVIKPRYTAEAKILLENQDTFFTRPDKEQQREQTQTLDPEAVQSQVQLVTSRDLARQAAQKLDLLKNPEFDSLLGGVDPLTRVLILLGAQKDPAAMSPEDRVLETYFNKLTVFPVAKTRVLTVEFVSRSPELAAQAANTIAEMYLGAQEEAKRRNAKSAAAWLLPAIEELRVKVQQKEAEVADFRGKSGLLIGSNNTIITNQQLSELNIQLSTARAAMAEAHAKSQRLTDLLRQGRVFEVSEVVKDELVRRIGEQRVTLKAQLALESRTLLPGHPRIKELQAQLADVEAEIRRAAEKIGRALEGDAKVASARVRSLEATLDTQKKVAATGDGEDVQLRALEREAKSTREQLESYLGKYREASARDVANATTADARIISRAVAPQLPSFPKKLPMLLISGLAALVASTGLVVSRLFLSGSAAAPALIPARRREDELKAPHEDAAPHPAVASVRDALTAPVHFEAPQARAAPRQASVGVSAPEAAAASVAAASPRPVNAESVNVAHRSAEAPLVSTPTPLSGLVRVVRGLREERAPAGGGLCVLVTGARRGVGATASAISLGRALSGEARVVIVDLDFASPSLDGLVAAAEGEDAPIGLSDLLRGEAAFSDALHRDEASSMHVLPAGAAVLRDGEHDAEIARIAGALRQTYDYVILDAAAPAAQPPTLQLARHARAAIIVAPDPENAADEIVELLRQLPSSEACESLIYTPEWVGSKTAAAA